MIDDLDWAPYTHASRLCPCRDRLTAVHVGFDEHQARVAIKVYTDPARRLAEQSVYLRARAALGPSDALCAIRAWPADAPIAVLDLYDGDLTRWRGPDAERLELLRRLAGAVATLHAAGLVHGDLRPENVLTRIGDGRTDVALCDLAAGGARSPDWRPPDAHPGAPDRPADDLYALGLLAVWFLTGDAHARAEGGGLAPGARRAVEARWATALGPEAMSSLEGWLDAALRDGADRREVQAPAAALATPPVPPTAAPPAGRAPPPHRTPPPRRTPSRRALAALVGVGTLVAAGMLALPSAPRAWHPDLEPISVAPEAKIGAIADQVGKEREDTDEPARTVALAAYAISRTEVSQAEWRQVLAEAPVATEDETAGGVCREWAGVPLVGDTFPVVCVSFYDSLRFLNAASAAAGLTPAYYLDDACTHPYGADAPREAYAWWQRSADGYRLPTEAEWEWAARAGGQHTRYVGVPGTDDPTTVCDWSNVADASARRVDPSRRAFDCDDHTAGLAPTTSGRPNAYRLLGIGGNAAEWVWTEARVWENDAELRGASFLDGPHERLSNRRHEGPFERAAFIGLRVAQGATGAGCVREP